MSARNQLTNYELEEFFRSLQDLLVLSLNPRLSILVPIALFSSLSRRGLGTRIEGLWGHRIFEFNSIFLIGCSKTKKS